MNTHKPYEAGPGLIAYCTHHHMKMEMVPGELPRGTVQIRIRFMVGALGFPQMRSANDG